MIATEITWMITAQTTFSFVLKIGFDKLIYHNIKTGGQEPAIGKRTSGPLRHEEVSRFPAPPHPPEPLLVIGSFRKKEDGVN